MSIATAMQTIQTVTSAYGEYVFVAVFALIMFNASAAYATFGGWLERKMIARVHSRKGPVYTGPFGILQTVADLLKFLKKEMIFPEGSDRFLFKVAPLLLTLPTFVAFIFLPLGSFVLINSDYSLLIVLALLSFSPIAVLLGSWASNSKYSTLGGLRAAGMTMSYEVLVAVAAASIALSVGSMNLVEIVAFQAQAGVWFAVMQPIAFVLFVIGIVASVERNPFDLVEAESELVAGWKTEYGGVYFSLTLLGEYMKLLASAILFVCLFLGGGNGVLGDAGFILKILVFTVLMYYVRATALRLRMDQIFKKIWHSLVPLGILNFVLTIALVEVFF